MVDASSLALTFVGIVFPILAIGGVGLPYLNSDVAKSRLLFLQFALFFLGILDLGAAVVITLITLLTLHLDTWVIVIFAVMALGTVAVFGWVFLLLGKFAVEEAIAQRMTRGRD